MQGPHGIGGEIVDGKAHFTTTVPGACQRQLAGAVQRMGEDIITDFFQAAHGHSRQVKG